MQKSGPARNVDVGRAAPHAGGRSAPNAVIVLAVLVLLLSGRAMTLAYLGRAGGGAVGDPPLVWRLPLLGDAVIGTVAPLVAYLALKGRTLTAWTAVVAWNVIGIWDAASAYVVHTTSPWPSFFMIRIFGPSMFAMASLVHVCCIWLATRPEVRTRFLSGGAGSRPVPA